MFSEKELIKAWVVTGRQGTYHCQHKEWLRSNWPTLYYALEDLTEEYFEEERKK